jgi:hypothetical protein
MVGLRRVELAAGLVPLTEEVTDEPLGALVQGVEVCWEVGIIVLAEVKKVPSLLFQSGKPPTLMMSSKCLIIF